MTPSPQFCPAALVMGAVLRDGSEHPLTLFGQVTDALDGPDPDPRHGPAAHGTAGAP